MLRALLLAFCLIAGAPAFASEDESPRDIDYHTAPPAPATQIQAAASMKSMGCLTCHEKTDQPTMHANPGVVLGCTDCHGGNAQIARPEGAKAGEPGYRAALDQAHVQPRFPETWHYPASANTQRSY